MIWERIIAQENYHSSCWLSSWPWKHDSLEMFSITFTGWSYLWATCHSFLIRLSSIEELIVLQETKYTALCSSSIGFYSIEIEQTAYRNIFHCNLDHTPNFYRRQSRIFWLKKLEPTKCEQKLSSIWAGWAEQQNQENEKLCSCSFFHFIVPFFLLKFACEEILLCGLVRLGNFVIKIIVFSTPSSWQWTWRSCISFC